jgi:hypothetical protein
MRRKEDVISLEVKRFYINDTPVCCAWFGCENHQRKMCQFLIYRRMGTQPVCGLTGEDMDNNIDRINRVPHNCPLHGIDMPKASSSTLDDNCGNTWINQCVKCKKVGALEVVRPGKVQCSFCG